LFIWECDPYVDVQQANEGFGDMAVLLIAVMIAALISVLVRSKGRSFFKYAEMSRSLESQQSQDEPALRPRLRAMR
jgi:hypothetical protein